MHIQTIPEKEQENKSIIEDDMSSSEIELFGLKEFFANLTENNIVEVVIKNIDSYPGPTN